MINDISSETVSGTDFKTRIIVVVIINYETMYMPSRVDRVDGRKGTRHAPCSETLPVYAVQPVHPAIDKMLMTNQYEFSIRNAITLVDSTYLLTGWRLFLLTSTQFCRIYSKAH